MDLSSWLNHQDEEYFNIALFYLIDRNDCWKYIFLVDGQQSAAARKLVAKLLTTFYHDYITCSVKEMTVELSFTERVNHLCLDQGAVCTIPVKAMLQELLAEHFSESVISALVSEMMCCSTNEITLAALTKVMAKNDEFVIRYMLTQNEYDKLMSILESYAYKENYYEGKAV